MWLRLRNSIHQSGLLNKIGLLIGIATTISAGAIVAVYLNALLLKFPSYSYVAFVYAVGFSKLLAPLALLGSAFSVAGLIRNGLKRTAIRLSLVGVGLGIFGICFGLFLRAFIEAGNSE